MNEINLASRQFFVKWLRATWLGWLLGIPLIIVLALAGELVGIGGSQVLVGLGVGAGVGFMQGRALKPVLQKAMPWFWSSVIGLGAPFAVTDLARVAKLGLPYSLYACVAIGGLLVGLWQWRLLRPHFSRSYRWIPASVLGWSLAAGASALAGRQPLRGFPGLFAFLAIVALGGVVLGAVTGGTLLGLRRTEAST